eukprot:3085804-Pleurochrysis_carterae.AAC.2
MRSLQRIFREATRRCGRRSHIDGDGHVARSGALVLPIGVLTWTNIHTASLTKMGVPFCVSSWKTVFLFGMIEA